MLSLSFIGEVKKWIVWHKDNEIHGYKVFKEREDIEMCRLDACGDIRLSTS